MKSTDLSIIHLHLGVQNLVERTVYYWFELWKKKIQALIADTVVCLIKIIFCFVPAPNNPVGLLIVWSVNSRTINKLASSNGFQIVRFVSIEYTTV